MTHEGNTRLFKDMVNMIKLFETCSRNWFFVLSYLKYVHSRLVPSLRRLCELVSCGLIEANANLGHSRAISKNLYIFYFYRIYLFSKFIRVRIFGFQHDSRTKSFESRPRLLFSILC